jgi:hypothetical protein
MNKIYIGYDFESNPISVLTADSREKADIAWAGMQDTPHSVEEIDISGPIGIHGVAFLLTSRNLRECSTAAYSDKTFRVFRRGL